MSEIMELLKNIVSNQDEITEILAAHNKVIEEIKERLTSVEDKKGDNS